jgi:hypothetical protein
MLQNLVEKHPNQWSIGGLFFLWLSKQRLLLCFFKQEMLLTKLLEVQTLHFFKLLASPVYT